MTKKNNVTLFERIEFFLQKNQLFVIGISILTVVVMSLLMFNPDVSVGGDDSGYIKAGHDFIKGKAFPTWHGSFYSILLSFFMLIMGVNIVALKFTSLLFFAASFYFTYRIFAKVTNHTTATFVVLTASVSCLLNKYASTTFTEPFFIFIQSLFIFLFYNFLSKLEKIKEDYKLIWKDALVLGIITYVMIQTRSVSVAVFGITLLFLLLNKYFKSTLLYSGFTIASHILFDLFKRIFWNISSIGFEDQLNSVLLKNFYKPAAGNEDLAGLIQRFWDNSELYFSKHLAKMFGIRPLDTLYISSTWTITFYIIFIVSIIVILVKNKKMGYIVLYVAGMISITFISLQKIWDQERLIMIYFPLITGIIFYALFNAFSSKLKKYQVIPLIASGIMFIIIFVQSISYISKYNPGPRFKSGSFNSYTPDWQNYMLASKWTAENLDKKAVVACRKPEMSWIASKGSDIFKGIYRVEYNLPDSAYNLLQEMGATHVLTASLRLDPRKNTGKIIRTVNNVVSLAAAKYPGCLTLIKEFGTDEKAYLFKIDFPGHTGGKEYLESLDAAMLVNPSNLFILQKKAEYYIGLEDYKTALVYYDKAITEGTDDKFIYFNRGYCYFQQLDYKNGIADFKKAAELDPAFGHAWYNLAVCLFNTGDYKGSRLALQKARSVNFDSNNLVLETNLARMGF
ncbi:MAG: tetratricopeptide repeat protein [Prolixibacteraceae bacterium]|nr:tetratricopeptide repeat protein [Prolixibacteraceae bacterium]